MKPITYQDAVKMHKDKFGVEPVVTGFNFWQSGEITGNILQAIEAGKPYKEKKIPKGMHT